MANLANEEVIYRPYITHPKTGKRIWAKSRGLKAFRIVLSNNKGGESDGKK